MTDWWEEVIAPVAKPAESAPRHNQPTGELRSGEGHPVVKAMRSGSVTPADDPGLSAGVATQAAASLPTDLFQRARYFAAKRFPDDPKGMERYGIANGRIYFVDDDGKAVFEEAGPSLSPRGAAKYAASMAGPALPVIGGTAGGIAGATVGPWTGAAGATGGGAIGDLIRQITSRFVTDDKQFSPAQTAKEAVVSGIGQGVGALGVKFANRMAARDLGALNSPGAQARMGALRQAADNAGIELTPAEITNLRSLRGQQRVLQDMPRSADILDEFYRRRASEQIPKAMEATLQDISPITSAEVGARRGVKGAESAIAKEVAEREAAAGPHYRAAEASDVEIDTWPVLQVIDEKSKNAKGEIKDVLKKAESYLFKDIVKPDGTPGKTLDKSVAGLHNAKMAIDALIEGRGENAISRTAARQLKEVQDALRTALKEGSPEYKAGIETFAAKSPAVNALQEGVVGATAEASQPQRAMSALFRGGPGAINDARAAYEKAGAMDEWNAGLRSYLAESFDKASKEFKGGNLSAGANFRSSVYGTPRQKAELRAAMNPKQWHTFEKLMDVFEATGRVPQGGSMTTFNTLATEEMRHEGAGLPGMALKAGATAIQPHNWGKMISDWYERFKMGQHSEDLAKIITSPDAMNRLRALRTLPPRSERARYVVGQTLSQFGGAGAAAVADPPPEGRISLENE